MRAWLVVGAFLGAGCAVGLVSACGEDEPSAAAGGDGGTLDQASGPPVDGGNPTGEGGPALPPRPPFDWVGIIGTGQSLSVGASAGTLVSTAPSNNNGKLVDNGPDPKYPLDGGTSRFAIVPLNELIRARVAGTGPGYSDGQYPNNIIGETPHSGMASEITALFAARGGGDYVTMHSVVGWSGNPLANLNKAGGRRAFPASMLEARVFKELATAAGKTFGYGAIVLTHGESDAANQSYGANLVPFIDDYNTDLKAITGQTRDVVLLASQQSVNSGRTSSAVQLWKAGVANARIVCTGPKYQYAYAADNLHMLATGYRRLGEKYAEVFDIVVNQQKSWKPLQPRTATRTGATIAVTFDVPNPPLEWDTTLAPPHQTLNTAWANGRGFEVSAVGGGPLTITSAEITGADTVTLTLSAAPAGAVIVGYATVQDGATGYHGGLVTGYRGQLRDSDNLVGFDEETIAVTLTQGSATVDLTGDATLAARAIRDVVTGAGAPSNWTVLAIPTPKRMTMSAPWTGPTGPATLKIHHDLHNYAVHASLDVP